MIRGASPCQARTFRSFPLSVRFGAHGGQAVEGIANLAASIGQFRLIAPFQDLGTVGERQAIERFGKGKHIETWRSSATADFLDSDCGLRRKAMTGDLVEIEVEGGKGIIMPQRVVAAAPAAKLSATEQRALARAHKKITAINDDWVNSKGLTLDEANAAAKAGLIAEDQRWWWLESWQEGEREVERDIKAGRVSGPFENAEELLAHLHQQV